MNWRTVFVVAAVIPLALAAVSQVADSVEVHRGASERRPIQLPLGIDSVSIPLWLAELGLAVLFTDDGEEVLEFEELIRDVRRNQVICLCADGAFGFPTATVVCESDECIVQARCIVPIFENLVPYRIRQKTCEDFRLLDQRS